MNRFKHTSRFHHRGLRAIVPIIVLALILGLFCWGVASLSDQVGAEQGKTLTAAIQKTVVHCYAVEGRYPPSLAYLEDHYGLTYDKKKFFVDYQPIGANMMPDITVIALEENHD